jgi:hypothetical protein
MHQCQTLTGRLYSITAAAALSATALASSAASAHGVQFVAGHLFVAFTGEGNTIARYPIHDGVPARKADLVYNYPFNTVFSVRPDRSLYGVAFTPSGHEELLSFAPNSSKLLRMLDLPYIDFITDYNALAIDANRVSYVAGWADSSAGSRSSTRCLPSDLDFGIFMYAPRAHGLDLPLQCFGALSSRDPVGIAVDSEGTLYVPLGEWVNGVSEYGTPITNPYLLRQPTGASFQNTRAIALDADDRMWVLESTQVYGGYSYVANYRRYADGEIRPAEVVAYPTKQYWGGNVAVDDKYLYVGGDGEVLIYPKYANGRKMPYATLALGSYQGSVWVGVSE